MARDLAPIGYSVTVFDADAKRGGMIRTPIPKFRLPDSVIDEETGYILVSASISAPANASTA